MIFDFVHRIRFSLLPHIPIPSDSDIIKFFRRIFSYFSRQKSDAPDSSGMPNDTKPKRSRFWNDPVETQYFGNYGSLSCHETLVSDTVWTDKFRRALMRNYDKLSDKSVMEIGCGTGVLSVFACQAGVKEVVALEPSDAVAYAEMVFKDNKCEDKIFLRQQRVEDLDPLSPDEEKFDALISAWMGHCLFDEWMLPSVILGRDRFLKEGGLMFPEKANVYIALTKEPCNLKAQVAYWQTQPKEKYKVEMDFLKEDAYKSVIGKMGNQRVCLEELASRACLLVSLDLYTVKVEDIKDNVAADFRLTAIEPSDIYGFCIWFRTFFPGGTELDTSPEDKPTHWLQTILYVTPFAVQQGSIVTGSIKFRRRPHDKRKLTIDLKYSYLKDGKKKGEEFEFSEVM